MNDSKKLTVKKRNYLYKEILDIADFSIVEMVSSKFIDSFNINQAIFYGLIKAIRKIPGSFSSFFILDGNYKLESNIWNWHPPKYISIPKADSEFIHVAAASILAKVKRDELMTVFSRKYPQYGFDKHMGYGTLQHREAIQKYGLCPIHRKTFTKKITAT